MSVATDQESDTPRRWEEPLSTGRDQESDTPRSVRFGGDFGQHVHLITVVSIGADSMIGVDFFAGNHFIKGFSHVTGALLFDYRST